MATDSFIISLPALIALTIKGGIFWYALLHPTQNLASRLFLYFLSALTIVNIIEISGFYILIDLHRVPVLNGYLYYVFVVLALALLFHLVTIMALKGPRPRLVRFVYSYAVGLAVLLLTTDLVVADFKRYAYAIVREPGPLYILFELYALPLFVSVIGLLYYGMRTQRTAVQRLKNRWMLVAVVPMCLVIGGVVVLLHAGVKLPFNTNFVSPLAISYFLLVASYAIYQYRLFDLQFFLPWSKVRRRKTAFYDRIRKLVAEIADLGSPGRIVNQLAQCFACPVVLIDNGRTTISGSVAAEQMTRLPADLLQELRTITVTDEIQDQYPVLHASLDNLGIAAVVPFNSYHENSDGWLLLGRSFSDSIYSRLDFSVVEALFAKLAEEFLDQQLANRSNVSNLKRSLQRAQAREQKLQQQLDRLKDRQLEQEKLIQKLQGQLPVGNDKADTEARPDLAPRIAFLGKQKSLSSLLKKEFPQTQAHFSPASAGFRGKPIPEVLVCDVDGLSQKARAETLDLVEAHNASLAALFAGTTAAAFLQTNRERLAGTMVERVPTSAGSDYIQARVAALTGLVRATRAIVDDSYPVVALSQANRVFLSSCRQVLLAGRILCLVSADTRESMHLARYFADEIGQAGVQHFPAVEFIRDDNQATIKNNRDRLLVVSHIENLAPAQRARFTTGCLDANSPMILLVTDTGACELSGMRTRMQHLPGFAERREDLPYLIQHFTLQFNLATGKDGHLSRAQMDQIINEDQCETIDDLRLAVYLELESLDVPSKPVTPEIGETTIGITSLDDYLAQKEIELLKQTLRECGGNKAQAAALLGLKPNTLHYKLKRYGLLDYPREK